jgi:hypothetical protein
MVVYDYKKTANHFALIVYFLLFRHSIVSIYCLMLIAVTQHPPQSFSLSSSVVSEASMKENCCYRSESFFCSILGYQGM